MLTALSLRLRMLLFFLCIALASTGTVALALYLGYRRVEGGDYASGFIFAGILSGFGILAIAAGIWLLFDENVAKPIERLAATMRSRAHAGVGSSLDLHQARYLGDLAPAAQAVAGQLSQVATQAGNIVAEETARLAAEKAHLAALLTEIPVAIVLVSPSHQITLYDGQAADVLAQVHVPRLNASVFDYFVEEDLRAAHAQLSETRTEVRAEVRGKRGNLSFDLHLRNLNSVPGYMILVDDARAVITAEAGRPLTYDFDLSEHAAEQALEDRPLQALTFVVFDTETTGLMPSKDEIVQIGAVRVVNGRIIAGEVMDQLVNPGRRIPPASTKVHGISDAMVADAPGAPSTVAQLHAFAQDSVLVAHNAPFDMAFLKRHGKAQGLAWDHPIVDTVLLSAVLFGASETHTLDALCERLDITIPEHLRHTALGDAQATAEALCKMLPMLASRQFTTFGQLLSQTRKHGRLLKDMN